MPFIGTPLDTRNTFQSLVGKRFDGDGSTTAFTLDVAPSSTLDLEVFVGNVRQDPNSAYTLSGTTLTFTGAPPSGTNNIYVVHQAKSVGTIDVPDDIISGKTLVTLDNSADHVLIEDATDGELKKALIPAASFAGIDDQSSSNDDQLTITDTAVVINEDSDDVDFRVETNGTANMLFVSGGNDVVGLGAEGDLGVGLHVKSADAGGGSIDGNGNEIVVENDDHTGITILVPNDKKGNIYFADPDASAPGVLRYDHNNNSMQFHVNASERMRLDNSGQLFLGVTSSSGFNGSTFKVPNGFSVYRNTSTGGNGVLLFYSDANSTGGNVGYYLANGGLANYQSNNVNLSDERLKKDIVDCPSTWDKIKSLKVRNFKYTEDKEERVVTGLIAQETETVDANLVNSVNGLYGYEEEQKDGKFKQIYTTDLYHQMLKALQESQTRIETLEAKVKTLEG